MVDKNAHYLMCKGGVFYFTRHVPNDLQKHYETPRIVICLKTRSKNAALKASQSIAAKLDDFYEWASDHFGLDTYYEDSEDLVDHLKGIFRIDGDILENNEDYKFITKMIGRSEPSFHYMA